MSVISYDKVKHGHFKLQKFQPGKLQWEQWKVHTRVPVFLISSGLGRGMLGAQTWPQWAQSGKLMLG